MNTFGEHCSLNLLKDISGYTLPHTEGICRMDISRITQEIKNFVLNDAGMDKVGIAPVSRFNGAPEGTHPTDFLPGCRSVIGFCIRVPDGAVQSCFRAYEDGLKSAHGIYGTYGYTIAPNFHLHFGNYRISQFVEKMTGEKATPCAAGPMQGAPQMSMRHCAVACGLGEFGWSSIVLTPEFGPRNRFGAVLTTAELEYDPMYEGPRLCDPSKCHVCQKLCPTHAIPEYNQEMARHVYMDEQDITYSAINWNRCKLSCHSLLKTIVNNRDLINPNNSNPTDEDLGPAIDKTVEMTFLQRDMEHASDSVQHSSTWKCGNCLTYCPVGNWRERFYDTGLSRVDTSRFIDE